MRTTLIEIVLGFTLGAVSSALIVTRAYRQSRENYRREFNL